MSRTHYKDFHLTCNMLLHYLEKFENPIMLPNFDVEHSHTYLFTKGGRHTEELTLVETGHHKK